MYAKLLIGRRFSKADSNPAFFSIGKTIASFQSLGKHLVSGEILIIFVITGSNISRHFTKRSVGTSLTNRGLWVKSRWSNKVCKNHVIIQLFNIRY